MTQAATPPRIGDTVWFVEWPGHRGGISTNRPYAAIVTDVFDSGRVELYVLNVLHSRFEVSRLHDPCGQTPGSWRARELAPPA